MPSLFNMLNYAAALETEQQALKPIELVNKDDLKARLATSERNLGLDNSMSSLKAYAAALEAEQRASMPQNKGDFLGPFLRNKSLEAMKNTLKTGVIATHPPQNYLNWPTWKSVLNSAKKVADDKKTVRFCNDWKREGVVLNAVMAAYEMQAFPVTSANGEDVKNSGLAGGGWPTSAIYALLSQITLPEAKPSPFYKK